MPDQEDVKELLRSALVNVHNATHVPAVLPLLAWQIGEALMLLGESRASIEALEQLKLADVERAARQLNEIGLEVALWAMNCHSADRERLTAVAQRLVKLRDELVEAGREATTRERMP